MTSRFRWSYSFRRGTTTYTVTIFPRFRISARTRRPRQFDR